MSEIFEQYFNLFNKKISDYYELKRLDPSYTIVYGGEESIAVPADYEALKTIFEKEEPGSSKFLDKFMEEAAYKYEVGMEEFVWKPSHSIMEFADLRILKSMFKLQMFSSISDHIRKNIKSDKLRQLLEFHVLFLGATPQKTPALYSLMNHADLKLGTWYPIGGMHKIIEGMVDILKNLGVTIRTAAPVTSITPAPNDRVSISVGTASMEIFDYCVAAADYEHIDQKILPADRSNYTASYWDKRAMAPSSLLFYIGLDARVHKLGHHTLFFDAPFDQHAAEIYTNPKWPDNPLFYVCLPSKTDPTVAPEGCENMFILIPLAPGLHDDGSTHDHYLNMTLERIKKVTGQDLEKHIVYKRSYGVEDFKKDYNAYKGNAYGLANTLMQTAFLKPAIRSKHIKNLYFAGQLTTPGPGMPPSIISGQVVAREIINQNS